MLIDLIACKEVNSSNHCFCAQSYQCILLNIIFSIVFFSYFSRAGCNTQCSISLTLYTLLPTSIAASHNFPFLHNDLSFLHNSSSNFGTTSEYGCSMVPTKYSLSNYKQETCKRMPVYVRVHNEFITLTKYICNILRDC